MEIIHEEPVLSSYRPLAEHQAQTPESFYSGPPVLYHRSQSARLSILQSDLNASPTITKLVQATQSNSAATTNGHGNDDDKEISVDGVDIWVASDKFTLYRPSTTTGLVIPYPSISLHAVQTLPADDNTQSLYLQLTTADPFDNDEDQASISLTLTPSTATAQTTLNPPATASEATPSETETPTTALFNALSACANLHPDPVSQPSSEDGEQEDGDEDYGEDQEDQATFDYQVLESSSSGLPPPMPGSGGWITAENVGEFFDEEGNWKGRGLGPGAGVVRERDEEADGADMNGERTSDDTKWQRTG